MYGSKDKQDPSLNPGKKAKYPMGKLASTFGKKNKNSQREPYDQDCSTEAGMGK